MDIYTIVLRLIHILAGVFWAGGLFMLAGFIEPTSKALVPEGGKFMQRLMGGSLLLYLTLAGPLNIIAGLLLYWKDSSGLNLAWITTPVGLGFTVGALCGLVAFGVGFFISRVAAADLVTVGKEIQAAGKAPTPEQMSRIGKLQEKLTQATIWTAIALALAVTAMAISRYL